MSDLENDEFNKLPPIDYKNWREEFAGAAPKEKRTKDEGRPVRITDEHYSLYLEYLERWGKKELSAKAAGISYTSMACFRDDNPEFAAAEEAVLALRSQRIAQQLEREAMQGSTSITYDKDGNILNERKVLETPLRLAMLKRHGEGYVEKSELDITTKGHQVGAIVVPQGLTMEQWKEEYEKQQSSNKTPNQG